ncbi:Shikimate 5-dehydrogenase I alpha [Psychrobacter nivimaris]|uniref:Shikimate dehydrogenase (NADP(+)) n=1 Tax=Psychrobacter nivimaris TaxID=281738 RepID=A0A6N7BZL7_9GAMM|nr:MULTISPECIES: shikimate dehydrogenase [Psychrobacter]KAF0569409.1 Shikimate 5-dehydrogenase I alpha [Psychrobacter nivimaris]PKG64015.1 shikimate dehydrogenase [Psychrobacter sp. Choline-02u-13]PKH53266.1 shikimate dehydrogenase [Psychrobacter sp. Choline-02u-9]|tara:strand:- start:1409 stop:2272 length:864 start_codon:yes stop_codon:yes gene_type:complete
MTQHFIVIGNPIAHSKSPEIHEQFAVQAGIDISYQRQYCPDDAASFTAVVEAFFCGGGVGANVTVPFKQVAYDCCAARGGLSEHAKTAGAVNTLLLNKALLESGVPITDALYGDNTDGQGLINHIMSLDWPLTDARVALIGAGGAARGVVLPLFEAGIGSLTIANRTVSKAADLVNELSAASSVIDDQNIEVCATNELSGAFDIIINATSIGLSGDTLPLDDALNCQYAYDMMYGRPLPFLQHFAARGAQISEGYGMLIGQAALSFERWTGHTIDVAQATTALNKDR